MSSFKYDALVVLGAVMRGVAEGSHVRWSFPDILRPEEYSGRLVMGKWRARATAILHESAPIILVTGGTNAHPVTGKKDFASRAVELAKVIVKLGVPTEKVIPIGKLGASHTLGNVANLGEYLEQHPDIRRIGIICPRFQMLRAMVMHDRDPKLKSIDITWLEVEKTVIESDPTYMFEINKIYDSSEAQECWTKEQEGLWKLLRGEYKTQPSA